MNRSRWQMTALDASHSHPRHSGPPHLPLALPISTWLKQQRHPRTRTPCQSPRHTPTSGTRTPARPRSRTFSPRHANHVVCALRSELNSHAMQYKPSMVQDDGTKPVSDPSRFESGEDGQAHDIRPVAVGEKSRVFARRHGHRRCNRRGDRAA